MTKLSHKARTDTNKTIEKNINSGVPSTIQENLYKLDLSQSDLASKTGLTKAYISQYLKGASLPRADARKALAKALGITVGELVATNSVDFHGVYSEHTVDEDPRIRRVTINLKMSNADAAKVLAIAEKYFDQIVH